MPEDIRILWTKEVPNDFHARFSAHKKTYVYRLKIDDTESPFDFQYTTYLNYNLDYEKMKKASKEDLMSVQGITEALALKIMFTLGQ